MRSRLVDALKRMLKGRAVTYAMVAVGLGLSEASVKRMFSRRDFTLQRLEDICSVAGIDFGELTREATAEDAGMTHLTVEQEREIVSDPTLMLIALCAVGNWTFQQIVETYDIPEAECLRCLTRLDRQRIIELGPDNRIRSLIDRTFAWLPGGPIQRYFRARVESEFLSSKFDRPGELFLYVNGMLSRHSTSEVTARMRRVANEFADLHARRPRAAVVGAPRRQHAARDPPVGAARVSRAAPQGSRSGPRGAPAQSHARRRPAASAGTETRAPPQVASCATPGSRRRDFAGAALRVPTGARSVGARARARIRSRGSQMPSVSKRLAVAAAAPGAGSDRMLRCSACSGRHAHLSVYAYRSAVYGGPLSTGAWRRAWRPARRCRRCCNARLYPINELATQTGMMTGTVTNMMNGKGQFQLDYKGELLTGEATRVSGDERSGVANAYGARGTYMSCDYKMNTPYQGAGTCTLSNGAKYEVHLGG